MYISENCDLDFGNPYNFANYGYGFHVIIQKKLHKKQRKHSIPYI